MVRLFLLLGVLLGPCLLQGCVIAVHSAGTPGDEGVLQQPIPENLLPVYDYTGYYNQYHSQALSDQQESIMLFEKQAECDAFAPCFDVNTVKPGDADPPKVSNAHIYQLCSLSRQHLQSLSIPDNLPDNTRRSLETFRNYLMKDADNNIQFARNALQDKTDWFLVTSVFFWNKPTCVAYPAIDRVNNAYGLSTVMNGKAIDCEMLSRRYAVKPFY